MATTLSHEELTLANGERQIVFRGGSGPLLMWLHGIDGVQVDHPLLEALTKSYSVVAPLAPGFQDLRELDEVDNVHELVFHYMDILDALEADAAVVIGHSFGGMIGAEMAAHYPDRVSALVLISPVGLWNDDYPVIDLFAIPAVEIRNVLYSNPELAAPSGNGDASEDIEAVVALMGGLTSMAKFMFPIPERGLSRRLHRIKAPTLVVFGRDDAVVPPRYADDFAEMIGGAEKTLVPGGHMAPVESTEAVLEPIQQFLAR